MKTFVEYFQESKNKTAIMTFGRFQPPTLGHKKVFDLMLQEGDFSHDHLFIYSSHSQDEKNPIPYDLKLDLIKESFPTFADDVINSECRTVIEALKEVNHRGYKNVKFVVGSDRVDHFRSLFEEYNGKEYHFNSIELISSGDRSLKSDISATMARECAENEDLQGLQKLISENIDSERMSNLIKGKYEMKTLKEYRDSKVIIEGKDVSSKIENMEDSIKKPISNLVDGISKVVDLVDNFKGPKDSKKLLKIAKSLGSDIREYSYDIESLGYELEDCVEEFIKGK